VGLCAMLTRSFSQRFSMRSSITQVTAASPPHS
jgi:hypothetical protein